jgi:hypothetical protein
MYEFHTAKIHSSHSKRFERQATSSPAKIFRFLRELEWENRVSEMAGGPTRKIDTLRGHGQNTPSASRRPL